MTMSNLISATYHPNIEVAEFICEDGRHLLRSGGTLPWRINNPGDLTALIVNGTPAPKKARGYIGFATTRSGRTFLIFPDENAGHAELKANLKRKHGDKTIPQAISGYAPNNENNTQKYIDDLLRKSGVSASKKINECSDAEIERITASIADIEGYHANPETRKETWVAVSTINATDGSHALPGTEAILQTGNKEEKITTDATGRFPSVIHPADKTAVHIKVMDAKTKNSVTVGTIQGEVGNDFNLLAKFKKWKGVAGSEKITSTTLTQKKPMRYVIQPGDNLGKIAKLYRTSVQAIKRDNDLSSDSIYPGDALLINGIDKEESIDAYSVATNTTPKQAPVTASATPKKRPSPVAAPVRPAPSSTQPSDSERSKEGTGKVLALINPQPGRAPWMPIAIAEAKLRGGETELTLQEKINYHTEIEDGLKSLYGSNNAWCAAFVNWCLSQANYPIDNASYPNHRIAKARAHGFYEVAGPKDKKEVAYPTVRNPLFAELDKPIYGAIAMVTSGSSHGHHVGFVYAKSGKRQLIILGGNQNQRINFSDFNSDLFKSYETKDDRGKITKHSGSSTYLKYFVPTSYYEQAKKDLLDPGLEEIDSEKLNKAMGIENEKPKKNSTQTLR